eukprot:10393912-Alexandrium_andersonii.AAC.1
MVAANRSRCSASWSATEDALRPDTLMVHSMTRPGSPCCCPLPRPASTREKSNRKVTAGETNVAL